ncbi:alpha-ketoglutarate-dependent dioxygenase AlkB family protein [Marinobacter bohaiensis]|uniref:alpha-ketoglutarate-dependent dioxygenase AlkB family protein n=1 Tax=Marinobacter bohaiensis TaxID=2201898 RepID=UPI000DAC2D06|nr:alpha-ketoglutarate-dependent dioxygenase AlkB [Marinobacter bohaiensis]
MRLALEKEAFFDLPPFQVRLVHDALPRDLAQRLCHTLPGTLPWYQARLQLFGQWHWSPRLQAWIGDDDAHYRYSGHDMAPEPWTPELDQVRERVGDLAGHRFNSVLCNWYRGGRDSMGWHSDDEPELGAAPVIASLSLGEERRFQFRRSDERRLFTSIDLPHNSLLIMPPGLQSAYQHQIPKTRRGGGDRFNLTFRLIQPA